MGSLFVLTPGALALLADFLDPEGEHGGVETALVYGVRCLFPRGVLDDEALVVLPCKLEALLAEYVGVSLLVTARLTTEQNLSTNGPATVVAEIDWVAVSSLRSEDHAPCSASTVVVVFKQTFVHDSGEQVEMLSPQITWLGLAIDMVTFGCVDCEETRGWPSELFLDLS